MEKFETKTQLLLGILLKEALEDLEFSDRRVDIFTRDNDKETLEIEIESNKIYKERVEKIKWLINFQNNSYCNRAYIIHIGTLNSDGCETTKETYVSETF